ncbi:toxic anion resistance protein [Sulfurospirillum arcachonense]|uniref:toxic anion resistance protein n=1 Tax=Sulfurospirillum arcachonense TaxID=57666 RepID=UPI000469CF81
MQEIKKSIDKQEMLITQETSVFEDNLTENNTDNIKVKAKEFLEFFVGKDKSEIRGILESITLDDIEALENSSALLGSKISNIESIDDTKSNDIAKTLVSLSNEVSKINPNKHNLSAKSFLSMLPFVGKPINKYLTKFKSASELIDEILNSLNDGEKLLRDDNIVLQHDKDRYKKAAIDLQRKALVMQQVINAIENNIENLNDKEKEFYVNNLMLNLQKKIRSIYEILIVTQEGFLSNDFIINTNWELIDNISNVKVVTKRALEVGVSMLVALENQKNVIEAVEKTKEATNELIVGNAKRMNEQGTKIYEKAGKATLSIESLKEAFANIDEAMTKISTLKTEALKQAKEEVSTMKEISHKLEAKINEVQVIEKITAIKTPNITI